MLQTRSASVPKNHQDWFDDNSTHIQELLQAKNVAHDAKLRNPGSVSLHNKWKELRSQAQKELRLIENKWWTEKAEEIQSYANNNDTQKFYNAIKAVLDLSALSTQSDPKMAVPLSRIETESSPAGLNISHNYSTALTLPIQLWCRRYLISLLYLIWMHLHLFMKFLLQSHN